MYLKTKFEAKHVIKYKRQNQLGLCLREKRLLYAHPTREPQTLLVWPRPGDISRPQPQPARSAPTEVRSAGLGEPGWENVLEAAEAREPRVPSGWTDGTHQGSR